MKGYLEMKRQLFVGVSVAVLLSACSSQPVKPVASASTVSASPSWVDNPELSDAITGVGIAQSNPLGDKSMQRTTAIANARVDLAQKIRVRVQNMFTQLNQQSTSANSDDKNPIRNDVASRMTDNVSRILTNQEMAGSSVRQIWTDPEDGNLYAFVVLSKDSVNRALGEIAKSQIQQEIDKGEKNLGNALQNLDKAVAESK
jgi:hypothetical protein